MWNRGAQDLWGRSARVDIRECLLLELRTANLKAIREQWVKLNYKGTPISPLLRLDLVVEESVVVELKSVERIHPVHLSQVITYLKLTDHPAGLIMNFNVSSLRNGIRRVNHPDRYSRIIRKPVS